MMTVRKYEIRPEIKLEHQRAWFVFIAAALLTPICFIIGGLVSGPNAHSLGEGSAPAW